MRKRFKKKAKSCALCNPHKMKWQTRWKKKDLDFIERSEKEMHQEIRD